MPALPEAGGAQPRACAAPRAAGAAGGRCRGRGAEYPAQCVRPGPSSVPRWLIPGGPRMQTESCPLKSPREWPIPGSAKGGQGPHQAPLPVVTARGAQGPGLGYLPVNSSLGP